MELTLIFLFILLISLIWLIGYILCIVRLTTSKWDPIGKREIIYAVALITGLAGIVGYINIKNKEPIKE